MTLHNTKLNKFIHSSLTLAFLSVTAFATAYCYGWGLAAFHGYPWWHVEVSNASVARSLVYVLGCFIVIFVLYLLGYALLHSVLKLRYFQHLGWLRVIILVSIFGLPSMLMFYLFIGNIPLLLLFLYVIAMAIAVFLFKERWDHRVLHLDIRKMFNEERFWFFNLFIFLYFSLLAFSIGYVRSEFRTIYDYLQIGGKNYYILSANMINGYILGEKMKGNTEFIFFNRCTQDYYRVYIKEINE